MLVYHFLENSASRFPEKIALVHKGIRATYAQINSMANGLARWLLDNGVNQGDRVVILLNNSLEYVVSYYGILKAGAVAVPLSTGIKAQGLAKLLSELEPFGIISSKKLEKLFTSLLSSVNGEQSTASASQPYSIHHSKFIIKNSSLSLSNLGLNATGFDQVVGQRAQTNPEVDVDENSLASIIYTSGSTGEPKGVMLSHRNIVSNTLAICESLDLTEDDVQMVVLPFFYVMGKSLLNTHFAVGGRVIINNKFAFPATVLREMVEENVTGFSGVPSTYAYLLCRSPLAAYRNKLSSLRYCSQAGGHMARAIKKELRRVLPDHTHIYIMYGATEVSARLTYLDPQYFNSKMDSIGKPIPMVSLKVLDPQGHELPPGAQGELVASGPNIMLGYWRDPVETSKVLNRNGYHTGDLGYKDKDGFFYVKARKDDLIKGGGHRINPLEIEDVILSSGLVMEAVVLGIPDDLLGCKLVIIATARNGSCDRRDIMIHLTKNLPRYKIPSEIKLVKSVPKTPSGKIDRNACRQIFQDCW